MIYRAAHILPMSGSPIEDGEIMVREGRIAAIGRSLTLSHPGEPVSDLGNAAIMPGFINAHCHLDYSTRRLSRDGANLWDWIEQIGFGIGRMPPREELHKAAVRGAVELARSGVTCVGDSTFSGAAAQAIESVGLRGVVYQEVFGQSMRDDYSRRFSMLLENVQRDQTRFPPRVRLGISPHAVYTSNRGLLELCAQASADERMPIAIHLAETKAETDYLLTGTGPLAEWRRKLGFEPMTSGVTPARYLQDIGLLREGVCLAHCVHVAQDEIELIAGSGAGVAHCPRSNAFLGAGVAPLREFRAANARVGLGTDSSASALSFDFFEEMRFAVSLHRAVAEDAGAITANDVLIHATLGGAQALGLSAEIGTLEVGKRADLIAIDTSAMVPGEDLGLAIVSRSPSDVTLVLVDGNRLEF